MKQVIVFVFLHRLISQRIILPRFIHVEANQRDPFVPLTFIINLTKLELPWKHASVNVYEGVFKKNSS